MGSLGAARTSQTQQTSTADQERRQRYEEGFRDGTSFVDSYNTMYNAKFTSHLSLRQTIEKADGGSYDIVSSTGGPTYGSYVYTDNRASDGVAYEIEYGRTYADPDNPTEIRVRSFRKLEEGEW